MEGLSDQALIQVAQYFQALAEPTRLRILNALRDGKRNVGEVAAACGCSVANISRHLAVLAAQGLVAREGRGTSVYYEIADDSVYPLCDLVCTSISRQLDQQASMHRAIGSAARKAIAKGARSYKIVSNQSGAA